MQRLKLEQLQKNQYDLEWQKKKFVGNSLCKETKAEKKIWLEGQSHRQTV